VTFVNEILHGDAVETSAILFNEVEHFANGFLLSAVEGCGGVLREVLVLEGLEGLGEQLLD